MCVRECCVCVSVVCAEVVSDEQVQAGLCYGPSGFASLILEPTEHEGALFLGGMHVAVCLSVFVICVALLSLLWPAACAVAAVGVRPVFSVSLFSLFFLLAVFLLTMIQRSLILTCAHTLSFYYKLHAHPRTHSLILLRDVGLFCHARSHTHSLSLSHPQVHRPSLTHT